MDLGQVAVGAGLTAWGLGFGFLLDRYRKSAGLRLRVAQSRWRIDRKVAARRGLSEQEWLDRFANGQRQLVTWFGLPFVCLFVVISLVELAHGLLA